MINVKEAAAKAKEHLGVFFPDAEKVQLEEVELTDDKAYWYITLGYEGVSHSVASSLLVGKSVRYKLFKIDAETGEVISMKIRDIK
ncbi:MAG: PepSY domain-containing protein [Bacteroidota bacterium]